MILHNDHEHRMWIAAMAAGLTYGYSPPEASGVADSTVEEYRKRCPETPLLDSTDIVTAFREGWELGWDSRQGSNSPYTEQFDIDWEDSKTRTKL